MNNKITTTMNVKDNLINVIRINNIDYISLTDLARYKNPNNPGDIISQKERLEKLNQTARKELAILVNDKNIVGIEKLDKKNDKLIEINSETYFAVQTRKLI